MVRTQERTDPDNNIHDWFYFTHYPIHDPGDEPSCLYIDGRQTRNDEGRGDYGYYGSEDCMMTKYFACQNFSGVYLITFTVILI